MKLFCSVRLRQKQQQQTQQRFEKAGYPSHVAQLFSQYEPEQQVKLMQSYQAEEEAKQNQQQDMLQRLQGSPQGQQILQMLQRASPEQQQQAMAQLQQGMPQQQIPQQEPKIRPPSFAKGAAASEKGLTAAQQKKFEEEEQKKAESKKHVQKAFDRVEEILNSGYTGYSLTGLSPEGRKQRSELDTLSEVFASNMIPLLNPKGTMPESRFKFIKTLLPSSWDTDATMKGKMAALKEIFELGGSSSEKSNEGTIEMQDNQGNIYDIPEDQVEKARKAGLK